MEQAIEGGQLEQAVKMSDKLAQREVGVGVWMWVVRDMRKNYPYLYHSPFVPS